MRKKGFGPFRNRELLRGFTLIELLIAILIFSIVSVAIYSTFSTGLIAWKKGEESGRLYQEARLALNKMGLDLRNALFYTNIRFVGEASKLYFATLLPCPEEENQLRLYKVTYYLDDNQSLKRHEESLRSVLRGNTDETGEEKEAQELAYPVSKLKFSYGYEYSDEAGEEPQFIWEDNWEGQEGVPSLVRITLALQEGKDPVREISFTRTVYISPGIMGVVKEEEEEE